MKSLAIGSVLLGTVLFSAPSPASASSASSTSADRSITVLRGESALRSIEVRPIRRRDPYSHPERQAPYGFLNVGGGVFDPARQPGGGFYGVIAGGTEVGRALDIGVQLSWFHRSSEGEVFGGTYVGPGGNVIQQSIQTQSVDTDLLPLMGIVRLRFPIPGFQPYIGGGAGYEWLFIDGVDSDGYAFTNDYGGFGAQAMAGLNLSASPTVALYGEAVYNWSTVEAEFYDPFYGVVIHESLDYNGLAYHGGLRFRF